MREESPWIGLKFLRGLLSLLLRNVDFMDEAIYKCSAITPHGRGKSTIKLTVEDSEMPQVQFDRIDDEAVAKCISRGWYLASNVTWLDWAEREGREGPEQP